MDTVVIIVSIMEQTPLHVMDILQLIILHVLRTANVFLKIIAIVTGVTMDIIVACQISHVMVVHQMIHKFVLEMVNAHMGTLAHATAVTMVMNVSLRAMQHVGDILQNTALFVLDMVIALQITSATVPEIIMDTIANIITKIRQIIVMVFLQLNNMFAVDMENVFTITTVFAIMDIMVTCAKILQIPQMLPLLVSVFQQIPHLFALVMARVWHKIFAHATMDSMVIHASTASTAASTELASESQLTIHMFVQDMESATQLATT